jgi:gamma-glutamylcyclotransferase (GGCT)/AIG2-like uncharacterized protein YtfP
MKLYFAYGANLNIESMRHRCPGAVAIQPWYLDDHRLAFSGVATVQPAPGQRVPGALWAITNECERSLDRFEAYPSLYRKEQVQLDGRPVMFYVMNQDPPAEPAVDYLMTIAEGYEDFGLCLQDLWTAVKTTQEESYDLQWSTNTGSTHGESDTDLADHVYLESGHDLRWLRDVQLAHRDPDTV